jgi:hypothetical protein
MTQLTTDRSRTNAGFRWRRLLMVGLLAIGFSSREARAQDTTEPASFSALSPQSLTPIADAIARLEQGPAPSAQRQSPLGRHPILLGTAIGAAGAAVWQASACGGSSCNTGTAALVGAGVGAYTGLVVSAVQSARAGRPVSRRVKVGLAVGAIGAVAGGWLACYGAGGCGGSS